MNMHLREGRSYAREFVEVPGGFRRTVEDAIEGLIAVLDQLDADPDLENDDTGEPTLGWPEAGDTGPHGLAKVDVRVSQEDGEIEEACEDEGDLEDDADLGWPEVGAGAIPCCGFVGNDDEDLAIPETSAGLGRFTGDYRALKELRAMFGRRLNVEAWNASKAILHNVPGSFLLSHTNCVITSIWPDRATIPEISLDPANSR